VQTGEPGRHAARAAIARARGELDRAIAAYRQANAEEWNCEHCWLWELGEVYEAADQPDSALAAYQRAVSTPSLLRVGQESLWRGPALKRLGELHEQRGEREKALEYYGEFVDLWKDADPELQPLVEDVRARIARLVREAA
jgi:tetratricopeptide (TPR) repeat protein